MTKTFVLDTNVLLHNADSIFSFADNDIVLPMAVMEELDKFKSRHDELGRNARQVIRALDAMRAGGSLRAGAPTPGGGRLRIFADEDACEATELDGRVTDNRILRLAYALHRKGDHVIFVSKDINARLKADALGIPAEDFESQKVNIEDLYTGYSEITVPGSLIDAFFRNKTLRADDLRFRPNEFVLLKDEHNERRTALGRMLGPGVITHLSNRYDQVWNIQARNKEQRLALELLMDPDVQMVTIVGQAGTGKTLLALAAGLHTTLQHRRYDRILVSRPVIPMGKDIGYLPGAKEEKLAPWMQPIFDNLMYLMRDGSCEGAARRRKTRETARDRVERLLAENVIILEALTYIRGRNIPGQYVIIDEAQNLTPHEVKTVVSRAGENTKMVLTGDPWQIDNPYLDASSNGLIYAAERLKDQKIHGHVTLRSSVRSALAAVAAEHL